MFHGPKGMLDPMPDRMSHDAGPRGTERPGIRAQNTSPLVSHPNAPSREMTTIWSSVSAWKAAATSA